MLCPLINSFQNLDEESIDQIYILICLEYQGTISDSKSSVLGYCFSRSFPIGLDHVRVLSVPTGFHTFRTMTEAFKRV